MQHYTHSSKENPNYPRTLHTPVHNPYMGKQPDSIIKGTICKLNDNNQKRLQKIVGNFLYYDRAVDPTMLMTLNSLAVVQTKPTIQTTKQVTQF